MATSAIISPYDVVNILLVIRLRQGFMSVEAMVQGMIDDLTESLGDAAKHDGGNSAAGTRVRKAMQSAKATAQAVRSQVQNDKNSR
jgi:hypothetical protein